MSNLVPPVTATEIAQLAGVTRATVSNWRRRHDDFPAPIGGTESRPVFDWNEVQAWLVGRGKGTDESPITGLRTLVRSDATADEIVQVMTQLRASAGGWEASGSRAPKLLTDMLPALNAAAVAEGPRAAIDALAERVLDKESSGGVYVTPRPVASLMAALASSPALQPFESVLDPACGSGSLLLASIAAGATELYGQDVLAVQVERARLHIQATTEITPHLHSGNSLTDDTFRDLRVDAVLCNPPFGQKDWGIDDLELEDERWEYGSPTRSESELAWVQHAVAHLRPGGTAVLVLPPAAARRGTGRKIRGALLRKGALRAVVELPAGVAPPWGLGLHLWVLRRPVPGAPTPDSVLFVDTSGSASVHRATGDVAWGQLTDLVTTAWYAFDASDGNKVTVPGVASPVRVLEVLDEDVDLTPARHLRSSVDPAMITNEVDRAVSRLDAAVAELSTISAGLGRWSVSGARSWREAALADLVNGGAVQWIRSSPPAAQEFSDTRRVLTAADIATSRAPSASFETSAPQEVEVIQAGDVLVSAVRSGRSGSRTARVAENDDVGAVRGPHVHLLRPTKGRIDGWFMAGFINGADNVSMTRTQTLRFDPAKLRIPLLSFAEQQRYGQSFRRLHHLRAALGVATDAADQLTELVTNGLTTGAVTPQHDIETPNVKTQKRGGTE